MNLTSPSQVKAWCIANDFHPNRTLGQNFLVDRNALVAIVDAGLGEGAAQGVRVLEVGPGLGVLTEEMLRRGAMVTAVEKDPVLAARLAESLGNPPGLTVVEGDALDVAAGRGEFAMQPGGFDFMVSNLPYQSGTRILLELVTRRNTPLAGQLTARAGEGDALTFAITTRPVKGELRLLDNGRFVYTPRQNKRGRDYFGYRAIDGEGRLSQEATAIIRIE